MDVGVAEDGGVRPRPQRATERLRPVDRGVDPRRLALPPLGEGRRRAGEGAGRRQPPDLAGGRGRDEVEALGRQRGGERRVEAGGVDGAEGAAERLPLPAGHPGRGGVAPRDPRQQDGGGPAARQGEREGEPPLAVGERGENVRDAGVGEGVRHGEGGPVRLAEAELEEALAAVAQANPVDGGRVVEAERQEPGRGHRQPVAVGEGAGDQARGEAGVVAHEAGGWRLVAGGDVVGCQPPAISRQPSSPTPPAPWRRAGRGGGCTR